MYVCGRNMRILSNFFGAGGVTFLSFFVIVLRCTMWVSRWTRQIFMAFNHVSEEC